MFAQKWIETALKLQRTQTSSFSLGFLPWNDNVETVAREIWNFRKLPNNSPPFRLQISVSINFKLLFLQKGFHVISNRFCTMFEFFFSGCTVSSLPLHLVGDGHAVGRPPDRKPNGWKPLRLSISKGATAKSQVEN